MRGIPFKLTTDTIFKSRVYFNKVSTKLMSSFILLKAEKEGLNKNTKTY